MKKVEKNITAWDKITNETPGESSAININGKTIHTLVEELKEKGLRLMEQRGE